MSELQGKVALVTGAGVRVGAEIARALAERGSSIAIHYRASEGPARALCAELETRGVRAEPLQADLFDLDAARTLVDRTVERFGRLDVLVPSAATFERILLDAIDDATFERTMRLHVQAPFAMAQRAAPELRANNGNIVLVTCTSVERPYRDYLPYVVSKAATHQLMRTLALELAPDVRVNAVAPGTVLPPDDLDAAALAAIQRAIPLQRFGRARDVAEAVVYLATAPFVTGQALVVDGGRTQESAL